MPFNRTPRLSVSGTNLSHEVELFEQTAKSYVKSHHLGLGVKTFHFSHFSPIGKLGQRIERRGGGSHSQPVFQKFDFRPSERRDPFVRVLMSFECFSLLLFSLSLPGKAFPRWSDFFVLTSSKISHLPLSQTKRGSSRFPSLKDDIQKHREVVILSGAAASSRSEWHPSIRLPVAEEDGRKSFLQSTPPPPPPLDLT